MKEKTINGHTYQIWDETDNYYLLADDTKEILDKNSNTHTLHRLVAKESKSWDDGRKMFKGQYYGYVEHVSNVQGNAIVNNGSMVYGQAIVCDDAVISNSVVCCEENGDWYIVRVGGSAEIWNSEINGMMIKVGGEAKIHDSKVIDYANVFDAKVYDRSMICWKASVEGKDTRVYRTFVAENARIAGAASVSDSKVSGSVIICDKAKVEKSEVDEYAVICDNAIVRSSLIYGTVSENAVVKHGIVESNGIVCGNAQIKPFVVKNGEKISTTPQQEKIK